MFGLPFALLSRVPKIIVTSLLRRLNLLAPNVTKPEPLPYNVVWAKTLTATAMGIIFSAACPPMLVFVIIYLTVAYFLFARSLLFSNSRGFIAGKEGGSGLIWTVASKWLLLILFIGQVFLFGLHLAQGQTVVAVLLIPLPLATRFYHSKFDEQYAPQLQLLPMQRTVALDAAEEELGEEYVEKHLQKVFTEDTYVQPDIQPSTWALLRQRKPAPKPAGDWVPPPPCLRVAVLGASGGLGTQVVKLLIREGHTVVAMARSSVDIEPAKHRRLKKFEIDLWEDDARATLTTLLRGCDMVISCLGSRRGEAKIVHRGVSALLPAMLAAGVPRLVMVSCVGVGDSAAQLRRTGVMGWVFSVMFATLLSGDKTDLMGAESECSKLPKDGAIAAVVVRTADLVDGPASGKYSIAKSEGDVGGSVAREDVASFLVSLAWNHEYDRSTISVGGFVKPPKAGKNVTGTKGAAKKVAPMVKDEEKGESGEEEEEDVDTKILHLQEELTKLQAEKHGLAIGHLVSIQPDNGAGCTPSSHGSSRTRDLRMIEMQPSPESPPQDIRKPIYTW